MGAVDVVAMSFPTYLAPAGPHQLDPDYHQDIRPVPEKEDTTGRALSLLRPQAPSPKRTLFNACIYLTHGSFTKGGWRLCRRGAIYDLLEVRIMPGKGGAGCCRIFSFPDMLNMSINLPEA